MANLTWIVKLENNSGKNLRYVDGEDPKRNGTVKINEHLNFEGSGFCFPWVDIAKGELKKAIKFYDAAANVFIFQVYQSWNRDRLEWTTVENGKDSDARVLSPDSSMGDRKAIIIDNALIPHVFNQYPNYTRYQSYYNNWMNMTHHEYYKNSPGDTGITGIDASNFMTDIYNQLKYTNGPTFLEKESPFNGYLMESWHVDIARTVLDTNDWGIEYFAGLTGPWRTLINCKGPGSYGSVVSHEFGHQYQNSIKANTSIGGLLRAKYTALRQADYTANTPEAERFAEDFRYFFGVTGIRGNLSPNDDYYKTSGKVRKPDAVAGLKDLMRGSWPVYNYLHTRSFTSFSYNNASWFQWYANNRWEAFSASDGIYYWHNGKQWIKI